MQLFMQIITSRKPYNYRGKTPFYIYRFIS
jgi:hypothetical protein